MLRDKRGTKVVGMPGDEEAKDAEEAEEVEEADKKGEMEEE